MADDDPFDGIKPRTIHGAAGLLRYHLAALGQSLFPNLLAERRRIEQGTQGAYLRGEIYGLSRWEITEIIRAYQEDLTASTQRWTDDELYRRIAKRALDCGFIERLEKTDG